MNIGLCQHVVPLALGQDPDANKQSSNFYDTKNPVHDDSDTTRHVQGRNESLNCHHHHTVTTKCEFLDSLRSFESREAIFYSLNAIIPCRASILGLLWLLSKLGLK